MSVVFAVAGALHFAVPSVFEGIVPRWLPARRALVYASGAAELACATGLAGRRPWGSRLAAAVLLGLWPANVQMAIDASRRRTPRWQRALLWARVPVQVPMIRMALAGRAPVS